MFQNVIVAALIACASGWSLSDDTVLVNDPARIESLIKETQATRKWFAGPVPFFDDMTVADASALMVTKLSHIADHLDECLPDSAYDSNVSIPEEFDARTKWPGLLHPIGVQGHCGSCWALTAAGVLGDRVAIGLGKPSPALSPQFLIDCDFLDEGCEGGNAPSAWQFMEGAGIGTEACLPYTGVTATCPRKCVNGEAWMSNVVRATGAHAISGVAHMQQEMLSGPIQGALRIYKSFFNYHGGVFEPLPNEEKRGGHSVKLIGWGTEDGLPFWWIANNWNTKWGLNGYGMILRGKDTCNIETRGPPYVGNPVLVENVVV